MDKVVVATANAKSRRLRELVRAPVSILAGPKTPSVQELQDLGVARVSYGSAFLKAAIGAVKRLAMEIRETGTITALKDAMETSKIAALVAKASSL